jgi:hypothetical protein
VSLAVLDTEVVADHAKYGDPDSDAMNQMQCSTAKFLTARISTGGRLDRGSGEASELRARWSEEKGEVPPPARGRLRINPRQHEPHVEGRISRAHDEVQGNLSWT